MAIPESSLTTLTGSQIRQRLFDKIAELTKKSFDRAVDAISNIITERSTGAVSRLSVEKTVLRFPDTRFNGSGLYNVEPKVSNRWRYGIGLESIDSGDVIYKTQGEIVSRPFVIGKPIKLVSLEASEFIPSEFKEFDPDREWITYFVSVDDGRSFVQINPQNTPERFFDDTNNTIRIPKVLYINTGIPEERRTSFPGQDRAFIDVDYPVFSVRLRIVLQRPEQNLGADGELDPSQFSPQVNSYTLKLFPQDVGGDI